MDTHPPREPITFFSFRDSPAIDMCSPYMRYIVCICSYKRGAYDFWPTGSVVKERAKIASPRDPIRTDLQTNVPGFWAAIVQPKRKVERAPGRGGGAGNAMTFPASAAQFTFTWVTHFAFDCSLHFTSPAASGRCCPVASCPPPAAGCWSAIRVVRCVEVRGWRVRQGDVATTAVSLAWWYPCSKKNLLVSDIDQRKRSL